MRCASLVSMLLAGSAYAVSIPATRSGYKFVDVSAIEVTGDVYPARAAKSDGTDRVLRAEDVACIAEAVCERDAWLNRTNAPTRAEYRTPPPSAVLSSNLLWCADGFFLTQGRSLTGRMSITASDPLVRFVDREWVDGSQSLSVIDTGFVDYRYEDYLRSYPWGCAAICEYLDPSATTVLRVGGNGALAADGVRNMYDNIGASKRILGGMVCVKYDTVTAWPDSYIGLVMVNGSTTYHGYDSPSDSNGDYVTLKTTTWDYWGFQRGCWIRASGGSLQDGRCSPYGWTTTSSAPYVVLRPEYFGKVESATLYLGIVGDKITSCTSGDGEAGDVILGFIRMGLTKSGTVSLFGSTCEKWVMPSGMCSSESILGAFIESKTGLTSRGFPCLWNAQAYSGVLDMVMIPNVDTEDDDD